MIGSQDKGTVYTANLTSWQECVHRLLDAAGLINRLASAKKIIIRGFLNKVDTGRENEISQFIVFRVD